MSNIPGHVRIILQALKFQGARPESLRTLADAQWRDFLSRWDVERLSVALKQACGDHLPDWLKTRIDRDIARNASRFERIKAEYADIAGALYDLGAEHVVLKGFAQWPGFIEHPHFRRQSDIDLFCPQESLIGAREALSKLGYEAVKWWTHISSDHLPAMIRKTNWKWRGDFYDPEMPISVELHFCFWNEKAARLGPKNLDDFWRRRVERQLDNFSFPALSDVDRLGYFALTLLRDLLREGPSIYNIYELARFLDTYADNRPFWKLWLELHDDSLRSLEAIPFRLASRWFACRLSEEAQKQVNSLLADVRAWLRLFGDSLSTAGHSLNKNGVWLHMSLLESPRDQRAILTKRLFPTRMPPAEMLDLFDISHGFENGQQSNAWKRARYFVYIASRLASHVSILPPTLWHGVRWRLSKAGLSRAF